MNNKKINSTKKFIDIVNTRFIKKPFPKLEPKEPKEPISSETTKNK